MSLYSEIELLEKAMCDFMVSNSQFEDLILRADAEHQERCARHARAMAEAWVAYKARKGREAPELTRR